MDKSTILIISSNVPPNLLDIVIQRGNDPVVTQDLTEIVEKLSRNHYSAVVVDLDHTCTDPLEVVLTARDIDPEVPILVLGTSLDTPIATAMEKCRYVETLAKSTSPNALRRVLARIAGPARLESMELGADSKIVGADSASEFTLRKPTRPDGKRVHALVRTCKPLDENSCYAYLLLCEHFVDTCVIAEHDGDLVGFVSAYIPPNKIDRVFVWQVAVKPTARGAGLGGSMLMDLLLRDACKRVKYLETTVSPSNKASARMFEKLAQRMNTDCVRGPLFDKNAFDVDHEEEVLYRIGPLNSIAP